MGDLFYDSGAIISPCGLYRTLLWRIWDSSLPLMLQGMLNPSTADASLNDPTVERGCRRARMLRFGGLLVANAYALRSTDPAALYGADDPIGPGNDDAIYEAALRSELVICGWGEHCDKVRPGRSAKVLEIIRAAGRVPHALAVNAGGAPKHPLYVGYDVKPQPFSASGAPQ